MDLTVDPCEDFYKFSCGSWKKWSNNSLTLNEIAQIKQQLKFMHWGIKNDVLGMNQSIIVHWH